MVFKVVNDNSIIDKILDLAGYTYGPLLGLFTFGLLSKRAIRDKWAWLVCIVAPLLALIIDLSSKAWMNGFTFGFLIIVVVSLLTYLGLWLISYRKTEAVSN